LTLIEKFSKVWGESLLKGDLTPTAAAGHQSSDSNPDRDVHDDAVRRSVTLGGREALHRDGAAESISDTLSALSSLSTATRVEARVYCSSVIEEFFPPSEDVRAVLRVIHIPATSNPADLASSAFQRELLDESFDAAGDCDGEGARERRVGVNQHPGRDELDFEVARELQLRQSRAVLSAFDEAIGLQDDCDLVTQRMTGPTGAPAGTVAARTWHKAPALRLSALSVSIRSVATQIAGIASLLTAQLRGRGLCATLLPVERLGCALLTLACGFTSHSLLARARCLMVELPEETSAYAAAAGYVFVPDPAKLVLGDVGSDVDCTSTWLRRHLCDHRERGGGGGGASSSTRSRSAATNWADFVEVCDVHAFSDTTAEIMNTLVAWRVKEATGKKYGTASGRLRATAKSVHVTGQKLMLWGLCGPSGGVAAGACFTRAEALLRVWQGLSLDVRLQLTAHSAAGCRVVVAADGATYRCICEVQRDNGVLGASEPGELDRDDPMPRLMVLAARPFSSVDQLASDVSMQHGHGAARGAATAPVRRA
jgi:hypothetical protein